MLLSTYGHQLTYFLHIDNVIGLVSVDGLIAGVSFVPSGNVIDKKNVGKLI
ncbi:hypothetical protein [Gilliamella sp. Bif1-4]|uniref:hypothetical protein n=1 Tax=Gilliamella sp. Bif1-4 TaxID=3120233 RepID=UPI00159EDB46|nr:hypothetical protein [Gilliamella apicola]